MSRNRRLPRVDQCALTRDMNQYFLVLHAVRGHVRSFRAHKFRQLWIRWLSTQTYLHRRPYYKHVNYCLIPFNLYSNAMFLFWLSLHNFTEINIMLRRNGRRIVNIDSVFWSQVMFRYSFLPSDNVSFAIPLKSYSPIMYI